MIESPSAANRTPSRGLAREMGLLGRTSTHGDRLVGGSDAGAQMHFVIDKIEGALQSLGGGLEDLIRSRVFVRNIDDWETVARAHGGASALFYRRTPSFAPNWWQNHVMSRWKQRRRSFGRSRIPATNPFLCSSRRMKLCVTAKIPRQVTFTCPAAVS
jgi:enamine deaminase RidA (YjgF/YER057c/UK114 family)